MSARGRRAAALCLTTLLSASLAACGGDDGGDGDDRVVGKRWQVTAVYDDPALPHGAPDGMVPPVIAFGRESYTGDGACGSFQGTLTWRDGDIVSVGEPRTVREADCDAVARTFHDRLRAQLTGDFIVSAGAPGLRMTAVGDHAPGEAAPGWAAVSRN